MVFYAAFTSISVVYRRQLTSFLTFLDFASTRLGSEVSCPRAVPQKPRESSAARTQDLLKHSTTEPRITHLNPGSTTYYQQQKYLTHECEHAPYFCRSVRHDSYYVQYIYMTLYGIIIQDFYADVI